MNLYLGQLFSIVFLSTSLLSSPRTRTGTDRFSYRSAPEMHSADEIIPIPLPGGLEESMEPQRRHIVTKGNRLITLS